MQAEILIITAKTYNYTIYFKDETIMFIIYCAIFIIVLF